MSPPPSACPSWTARFPCVSGDESFLLNDVAARWVFSPCERGRMVVAEWWSGS